MPLGQEFITSRPLWVGRGRLNITFIALYIVSTDLLVCVNPLGLLVMRFCIAPQEDFQMTKLITDAAMLTKAIGTASKAGQALQSSIQLILASAVYFAMKDGNIQPLNSLFTSTAKGVRKAAIQAWLLDHAPVATNSNRDDAKTAPFVFLRDRVAVLLASADPVTAEVAEGYATRALGVAWTEYKPEQMIPESFDVQAMVADLVKRAKGLQTKGSTPKHADLIGKLEAMAAPAEEVAPL